MAARRALRVGILAAAGAAALLSLQLSCTPPARVSSPAFYYWRTVFSLSPPERAALRDLAVSRVYLRFFDVSWDEGGRGPVPRARLEFRDPTPEGISWVPVVYLENRVFQRGTPSVLGTLPEKVWEQVGALAARGRISFTELQLDCDWTDGTREAYFAFVRGLRRRADPRGVAVSATIRLHQVKYHRRTGIPPVERGMLMFYNVGSLRNSGSRMSIYNRPDAEKYAASLRSYPLPVDVALPIFFWGVHKRQGRVVELLEKASGAELEASGRFEKAGGGRYRAGSPFFFRGSYFLDGDEVVMEDAGPAVTLDAARLAAEHCPPGDRTVAFFDFDERTLARHEKADFDRILALFR